MKSLLFRLAATLAVATTSATAADEEPRGIEEIVVTARRREESAQDVPLVVNTVTSEQISKLNIQSFTEVPALVPGLQLNVNANGVGSAAQIRGVQFETTRQFIIKTK